MGNFRGVKLNYTYRRHIVLVVIRTYFAKGV